MWVWWGSRLTPINFAVGLTSLGIQAFILVPWHDVISKQIEDLEKEQRKFTKTQADWEVKMNEFLKTKN